MNTTTLTSLQASAANVVKAVPQELMEKMKDAHSAAQIPETLQKQLLSLYLQDQAIAYQYPRSERRLVGDEQDLPKTGDLKYNTVTKALDYMNEAQYQSLKTFHKHLIGNCFSSVNLSKIEGSKWSSLMTRPAPALIHFYYNVSPAYIIVQDLSQGGDSKAMMIMDVLEDIMSKFDLSLKIVNRRSTSKKKKSKLAVEKSQKSNKSVLWETKTHLMLPDNEAASTMSRVEDCKLYQTLVACFKLFEQGTLSSEERGVRLLRGTSSRDHDIPSLDRIQEITPDQATSSSAELDIPSLDRIQEITPDQATAEHNIPSLDRIQEITPDQATAEHDIPSLDRIQEITPDQATAEHDIPSLDRIQEITPDQATAEHDIPSLDRIQEITPDQATAEHDIPSLDKVQEITPDQGTSSSAELDIPSLDRIPEITSDQEPSSSGEQDIPSLDRIQEIPSDQEPSSSGEHDIPSLDRIQEIPSDQEPSSSGEHDIPSLDRGKQEPKLPSTAKRTKQVEEMEWEIIQLKETARSLEDKFDESKRKLRAKEAIGVKSTETQTSKEQEEELQLKMSDLELTVSRLQDELRRSKEQTVKGKKYFKSMETYYKQQLLDLRRKNEDLNEKTNAFKRTLQNKEEYIGVTLADLGRALVERDTLIKEMKARGAARPSPVKVTSSSSQTSEMPSAPEAPTGSRGAEAVTERDEYLTTNSETTESTRSAVAVQESQEEADSRDTISLANIPTTTVERGLYNNYKLMLILITHMLLSDDVIKFKEWACGILSVDVTASVNDAFLELDRRGVISAVNLEKLREFFEKILRFDLVHMIDCFIVGDYAHLRYASDGTPRLNSPGITSRVMDASQRPPASPRTSLQSSDLTSDEHHQSSLHSQARTSEVEESSVPPQSTRPGTSAVAPSNCRTQVTRGTTHRPVRGPLVTNAPGAKNVASNSAPANRARPQVDMGSNGRKLSKFQRADSAKNSNSNTQAPGDDPNDSDDDSQWLCSHYKRRCYVKFNCCDKYWPCHRCHNNESKCGQKKLKSRDTKFLKCVSCGSEQQFGPQSQFCNNCHKKFAKYFCAICKHLTGTDDNPYHCVRCGICRIHSDRSFHCDVCGVCLDVQLRGNHKCRAGSAHDECCICLEDAFTGCQILPCSHKVHKECATQMIRSGITRCPICRESFAHKLERRPVPPVKKPPGK